VAVIRKAKERNNLMITDSLKIFENVLTGQTGRGANSKFNQMLIKASSLLKNVLRFYVEYSALFEKSLNKGDQAFPTVPLKIFCYKQLSNLNSNDKILQKKFKSVCQGYSDTHLFETVQQRELLRDILGSDRSVSGDPLEP
jgi:hypothetical protein